MRRPGLALLICLCLSTAAFAGESSHRTLVRKDLRIEIALPDRETGHYRGIRFDHGGIVTQASLRGHTFLGLLKPPHRPRTTMVPPEPRRSSISPIRLASPRLLMAECS